MPEVTKKLFELTPRDWRENDEVVARSAIGSRLIAQKQAVGELRRVVVQVEGDPADPGVRDAIFYALGIGRPGRSA